MQNKSLVLQNTPLTKHILYHTTHLTKHTCRYFTKHTTHVSHTNKPPNTPVSQKISVLQNSLIKHTCLTQYINLTKHACLTQHINLTKHTCSEDDTVVHTTLPTLCPLLTISGNPVRPVVVRSSTFSRDNHGIFSSPNTKSGSTVA